MAEIGNKARNLIIQLILKLINKIHRDPHRKKTTNNYSQKINDGRKIRSKRNIFCIAEKIAVAWT